MIEYDEEKKCGIFFEQSIDIGDYSYSVIYGYHINGGFIAIPNHRISCEASDYFENEFNKSKLIQSGLSENVASKIAELISLWSKNHKDEIEQFNEQRNKAQSKFFKEMLVKNGFSMKKNDDI